MAHQLGEPPTAFPPLLRATVYWVIFVAGLAFGGAQVGFWAADAATPVWLRVCLAVTAFIASGLGLTAGSHVVIDRSPKDPAQPEAVAPPQAATRKVEL